MEAFKLAFETTVVGILTLSWIALLAELAKPGAVRALYGELNGMQGEFVKVFISALLLALTYVLGSVVTPLSDELAEEDWHFGHDWIDAQNLRASVMYAEDGNIRLDRFQRELFPSEDHCQLCGTPPEARVELKAQQDYRWNCAKPSEEDWKRANCWTIARNRFHVAESALLASGTDRKERLEQLGEQRTVLKGATFNAIVFTLLCLFGLLSAVAHRVTLKKWPLWKECLAQILLCAPSISLLALAVKQMFADFKAAKVDDPPVAELVLIVFAFVGLGLICRSVSGSPNSRMGGQVLVPGFCIGFPVSLLMLGSWIWTEVTYDKAVVRSYYFGHRKAPNLDKSPGSPPDSNPAKASDSITPVPN